jgi:competence protein ComEC
MKVLIAILLLSVLAWRFYEFYQDLPVYEDGQSLRLEATLQQEPELSNRGQQFAITDAYNQTIYVTAEAFPRLHYGQVLVLEGGMNKKELEDGRVILSMYYPEVSVHAASNGWISSWANTIRERSKVLFENTLPPISASLLMGIVFGAKEEFPDDFFDALKTTGVLHVIAASGMNVTFISAAILFGLGYFMRRQVALIVGCFGIVFYVFLVGFEPSIIRASIMGILAFGASLFGRQHIAALAVLVSAYVMLLLQPGFLFDLGFQLSFLATLGIIFVKPMVESGKFVKLGLLGESVSTTLAAQVATWPLLVGVFGEFGVLSLLVNALVLWVVPVVMLFGSLAALFGFIFEPLAQLLLLLCLPFLAFFAFVVSSFGKAGGVMQLPPMPIVVWVGYYLLLAACVLLKKPNLQVEERRSVLSDI